MSQPIDDDDDNDNDNGPEMFVMSNGLILTVGSLCVVNEDGSLALPNADQIRIAVRGLSEDVFVYRGPCGMCDGPVLVEYRKRGRPPKFCDNCVPRNTHLSKEASKEYAKKYQDFFSIKRPQLGRCVYCGVECAIAGRHIVRCDSPECTAIWEERNRRIHRDHQKREREKWHGRWADSPQYSIKVARRRMERGAEAETISRSYVGNRDGWKCHLCGKAIDPTLDGQDAMGPTIDHLVPLSMGGSHTLNNVKIAHRRCNIKKGNRSVDAPLLFG